MKFRKIAVATVALLGAAAALSGCSAQESGSSDGTVSMTLWQNSTTGPGQEFWDKTVADFEAANPGVTITPQAIQNEDLDGKLQTALNSGDAPDIFLQRGGGKMAAMVAGGQLMDLTDKISDEAKSEITEGFFGANSLDDKVWAMPVAVLPGGVFYSQDLFAEAGITETPKTLADLDSAVTALKGAGAQPIALGAKDAWPAAHWYYFFALRECSADTMAEAADTKDFSDDCWVRAGEDLQDVLSAYNDAPFVSQWLDTVYGLNVGNAMNVAVVDLLSGDGTPQEFVDAVDAAAKKA